MAIPFPHERPHLLRRTATAPSPPSTTVRLDAGTGTCSVPSATLLSLLIIRSQGAARSQAPLPHPRSAFPIPRPRQAAR